MQVNCPPSLAKDLPSSQTRTQHGPIYEPDNGDNPFGLLLFHTETLRIQSLNLYSYGYNNPLTNTDPTGHSVNVCTTGSDGSQQCTLLNYDEYQASQQSNGSLNVRTLDQVGSNGNGSGQFNSTAITDASGNTVGTATYVSDGGADYYANANGFSQLSNTSNLSPQARLFTSCLRRSRRCDSWRRDCGFYCGSPKQPDFPLAHGTDLKALLDIGHNVPIAEIGEIKNAILQRLLLGHHKSGGQCVSRCRAGGWNLHPIHRCDHPGRNSHFKCDGECSSTVR